MMTPEELKEETDAWDAINAYAEACGADTSAKTVSDERMDAVVRVNRARQAERDAAYRRGMENVAVLLDKEAETQKKAYALGVETFKDMPTCPGRGAVREAARVCADREQVARWWAEKIRALAEEAGREG